MRHWIWVLALAAGCTGESIHPPDEPEPVIGPEGTSVEVDPSVFDHPRTHEMGTELTRPNAKTVEWPGIGTEEGAPFLGGQVVVQKVFREDAENRYGIRIRLKNKTAKTLRLEYVIRFYTRDGIQIAGYKGALGEAEHWTSFVLEPLGLAIVDDSARITGAEGFRLHLRGPGGGKGEPGARP